MKSEGKSILNAYKLMCESSNEFKVGDALLLNGTKYYEIKSLEDDGRFCLEDKHGNKWYARSDDRALNSCIKLDTSDKKALDKLRSVCESDDINESSSQLIYVVEWCRDPGSHEGDLLVNVTYPLNAFNKALSDAIAFLSTNSEDDLDDHLSSISPDVNADIMSLLIDSIDTDKLPDVLSKLQSDETIMIESGADTLCAYSPVSAKAAVYAVMERVMGNDITEILKGK
jgi:hypothetical protein